MRNDAFDITGRISFPVSKALAFSARSVRIRLGRMIVVIMGVASAIAFVIVLLSLNMIMTEIERKQGTAGQGTLRNWWLLVAGLISFTGITNAILMSVTERIKEIGTIRCLGAMSRHIIMIFLFEAMFLGLVGGFIGGVGGILATLVYSTLSYGWTLVAPAFTLVKMLTLLGIALAFSVGLCVISAIYPVYFAAKLEPADAMRYEV